MIARYSNIRLNDGRRAVERYIRGRRMNMTIIPRPRRMVRVLIGGRWRLAPREQPATVEYQWREGIDVNKIYVAVHNNSTSWKHVKYNIINQHFYTVKQFRF